MQFVLITHINYEQNQVNLVQIDNNKWSKIRLQYEERGYRDVQRLFERRLWKRTKLSLVYGDH